MSKKLNTHFNADINKELYDFTGDANYLLCYDNSLNYYAIINMQSGSIMERSDGNVYENFIDSKCYYAGVNSYFYEKDNMIYSLDGLSSIPVEDAMSKLNEFSENMMQSSIEESEFKSNEDIMNYVKTELCPKGIKTSECSVYRGNGDQTIDFYYNVYQLCNSMYRGPVATNNICYVKWYPMGFEEFYKYDGSLCMDTIFPMNLDGTCGIVAAAMLLQYYERSLIANTVSPSIYEQAKTTLTNGAYYDRSEIVSEILHDKINENHTPILDGSTYVTVKDAINKYFSKYCISGVSATSSASWWGLKSSIDNGYPGIVFVYALSNISYLNNDLTTYSSRQLSQGHAMYTYGYTMTGIVVDEYICHAGWDSTSHFYSVTYVTKTAIAGNVRLLLK